MLAQQIINGLSLGGVYALFALGFTLIFGVLNVINLAHGAIFMIGAYAALHAVLVFHFSLLPAIFAAMLVTGAAGWVLDKFIFAPLRARRAPHLAPMIATIGVAICLTSLVEGYFGSENLRFPIDTLPSSTLTLGSVQVNWLDLKIILLALLLMGVMLWVIRHSPTGRALRGVAESPKAAALLGVNVDGLLLATSVIASILGGVAGGCAHLGRRAIAGSASRQHRR